MKDCLEQERTNNFKTKFLNYKVESNLNTFENHNFWWDKNVGRFKKNYSPNLIKLHQK